MPQLKTVTVYSFDELSDRAKETAMNWWRSSDDFDAEFIIDDVEQVAAILGIEFKYESVPLMGGGNRRKPCIYWSGFYSQGDGASFEGWYSYKKGSCKAMRKYAPQDSELHRIADQLASWQKMNFYRLQAKVQHRGNYYHSGCMSIDVHNFEHEYAAVPEEGVADELRAFADWIYQQLQTEYEYQNSDEIIAENIRCNEYRFTKEGKIQ
jgi:hypothetical protein